MCDSPVYRALAEAAAARLDRAVARCVEDARRMRPTPVQPARRSASGCRSCSRRSRALHALHDSRAAFDRVSRDGERARCDARFRALRSRGAAEMLRAWLGRAREGSTAVSVPAAIAVAAVAAAHAVGSTIAGAAATVAVSVSAAVAMAAVAVAATVAASIAATAAGAAAVTVTTAIAAAATGSTAMSTMARTTRSTAA